MSVATRPEAVPESKLPERPESSYRSRQLRIFLRNPLTYVGGVLLIAIVLFCFAGPLVYHVNPDATNLLMQVHPPTAKYPLGTDALGRDVLIRLMLGGQLSLIIGFAAAIVTMLVGTLYGMISALAGGQVDNVMMRIIDVLISIPGLFLLLFLDSVFTPSPVLLTLVIAGTSWFYVSRLVRSEVLSVKQREYVEAARAMGASNWAIMMRYILPNVMSVVLVTTTFQVGFAILTIAGLSFLGLGLPPPQPNWGEMLSGSLQYIFQNAWWLIYPPGLMIVFVELAVNFLGDALRQAFDPRLLGA